MSVDLPNYFFLVTRDLPKLIRNLVGGAILSEEICIEFWPLILFDLYCAGVFKRELIVVSPFIVIK